MCNVNISIWTARPNGNGFHVHSHTLIGDAERESAFHQGPYLLFHPPPSLSFTRLPLSLFPSPSASVFYLLFYCYHISFSFPLSPATLTLLSFLLPASLRLFSPPTFLLQKTCSASFNPPLCFCLLIHCVPFVSYIDVFAIGDPNQSTILAVSIAGGIVLLIFLVTCFVVSGR